MTRECCNPNNIYDCLFITVCGYFSEMFEEFYFVGGLMRRGIFGND